MKLETRHIKHKDIRTSVALEPIYWQRIEAKADWNGLTWQQWVDKHLQTMPAGCNVARWIRVSILQELAESDISSMVCKIEDIPAFDMSSVQAFDINSLTPFEPDNL